jgi:hypothetical protein
MLMVLTGFMLGVYTTILCLSSTACVWYHATMQPHKEVQQ